MVRIRGRSSQVKSSHGPWQVAQPAPATERVLEAVSSDDAELDRTRTQVGDGDEPEEGGLGGGVDVAVLAVADWLTRLSGVGW